MANQFVVYKSTDASAPVLTGETGKLTALLDACLVGTGGTAYGSKASAGWGLAYSGTSKSVYRAATGARLYYRMQDDGPGAGTYKEARLTGYVAMTTVDAGTGPFPTAAQGVGSVAMVVARKSALADTTARPWIVVADGRTCYVFVQTGDSAGTYFAFAFGEIYSFLASDAYNGIVIGRTTESSATASVDKLDYLSSSLSSSTGGHFMAATDTGLGGSILVGKHGDYVKSQNQNAVGAGGAALPNRPNAALTASEVWVHDNAATNTRGKMRGFWQACHPAAAFTDGDIYTPASGDLYGKSFLFIKSSGNSGVYMIETSATLLTN